jgi:uncharacterized protein with PIN domain
MSSAELGALSVDRTSNIQFSRPMGQKEDIRFVAENTLGKLAKWLRMLGFDTVYEREPLAEKRYEAGRIRLTRTRRDAKQSAPDRAIFITSDRYLEQIRQVVTALGLTPADTNPFTRCIRCNAPIESIDKSSAFGQVPDYIWETQDTFSRCPQCNRVYWPGSHTAQSLVRFRDIFKE